MSRPHCGDGPEGRPCPARHRQIGRGQEPVPDSGPHARWCPSGLQAPANRSRGAEPALAQAGGGSAIGKTYAKVRGAVSGRSCAPASGMGHPVRVTLQRARMATVRRTAARALSGKHCEPESRPCGNALNQVTDPVFAGTTSFQTAEESISRLLVDAPGRYARAFPHTETDRNDLACFIVRRIGTFAGGDEANRNTRRDQRQFRDHSEDET